MDETDYEKLAQKVSLGQREEKQTLCKQMTPGGERAWDTGLTGSIRNITLTKNTISL